MIRAFRSARKQGKRISWRPSNGDFRVPWRLLRGTCKPSAIPASSTNDLDPLDGQIVGQKRALRALELATRVHERDYNVYVSGPARTGKTFLVTSYLNRVAKDLPTPPDWIYVHDFGDPDSPNAIWLPPGRGRAFRREMEGLVPRVQVALTKAFQGEAYQIRRESSQSQFEKERAAALRGFEKRVEASGFVLEVTAESMAVYPARDGKAMTEGEVKTLSEEKQSALRETTDVLQGEMNQVARELHTMERDHREREASLQEHVARDTLETIFSEVAGRYEDVPALKDHCQDVQRDLLARLEELSPWEEPEEAAVPGDRSDGFWDRYAVNLLVEHTEGEGAPVVMEPNPTYPNLFGKVERRAEMGVLTTDLTLIRPGAIHRANGGFLVLQAADVLQSPLSWDALKRAMRFGEVKIEDMGEQWGMVAAKGLSPDPIPLSCRVVLIGSPFLHQNLFMMDDQFRKVFKVKADLDDQMDRGVEEVKAFCGYLATVCKKWSLLPADRTGMARLVEYASELAGQQGKLTLQLSEVEDIVREAHIWAGEDGASAIQAGHVEQAVREKTRRSNLPEERIQELILQGVLKIETQGRAVGVVNGLSVYDLGDHVFARPTRVTGSISLGRDGVLDVEREAKLGGNIHTKGILILTGFLRWRYAQDKPLSLSASICFEQSYEDVEGDSASSAELCALLSSLANLPVDQGIAVTGAVSQDRRGAPRG